MNTIKKNSAFRLSTGDRTYYLIVDLIMTLLLIIVVYPLIYILSASFSSPSAVASGRVVLWPVDFGLEGYKAVFKNKDIVSGYRNTFLYTFFGTALNVGMTMIGAYPLSRKDLKGRDFFMLLFTFTMIFSGGMIPSYILMRQLHLINTPWVMIVPGAISVYNLIITRTFLQNTIPPDLLDASQIDGCSDTRYFFSIVLPLSKAILATITLFYAVGHWNACT